MSPKEAYSTMGLTRKAVVALAVIFAVSTMFAKPVEAGGKSRKEAASAYTKGKRLLKSKRYEEASRLFQKAHELVPRGKYLLFIGKSEAKAGNTIVAIEVLNRYVSQSGPKTLKKHLIQAKKILKEEESKVGLIEITGVDGGIVFVDGAEVGTLPLASSIPVTVGVKHSVWVVLDDNQLPVKVVTLEAKQSTSLEFIEPVEEEPYGESITPEVMPASTDSPRPLRTWGWISTGVGAALVIGGVVTGSVALSRDSDLVEACGGNPCPEKKDEVKTRDTLANTTTALLVLGGAVAVTGITLLVVDAVKNKKESHVALYPTLSPSHAGATLLWKI